VELIYNSQVDKQFSEQFRDNCIVAFSGHINAQSPEPVYKINKQ